MNQLFGLQHRNRVGSAVHLLSRQPDFLVVEIVDHDGMAIL